VTLEDHCSLTIKYSVTIYENKGKWEEKQKFSLNLQTQGVQMDYPQTQRMDLTKRRQAKIK
jgi:hypothetical protein